MASIELPLPHDPADYEPKAVAGKFSYRAFATIVAVIASEVPLILRLVSLGVEEMPNTTLIVILAAIPAGIIALIGLSKRQGLYFEEWFPPFVQELVTPKHIIPVEALPMPDAKPANVSREELRSAKTETPALEREAEALANVYLGERVVMGRAFTRDDMQELSITRLAPEVLVRHRLTVEGLRPRQVKRLRKRGVESVPVDVELFEEVSSHKWVTRRFAKKACRAAAEIARLIGPYDVKDSADVLSVLSAYGVDATEEQVTIEKETYAAQAEDGLPRDSSGLCVEMGPEEGASFDGNMQAEAAEGGQDNQEPVETTGPDITTTGVREDDGQGDEPMAVISADALLGEYGGQPLVSRETHRALTKAGIGDVVIDPVATTQTLMERYGIGRIAASDLKEAFGRLTKLKEEGRV